MIRWGGDARDGGAAAVEMALVLPLLLLLAFGIVDFGRLYNAQISLTEAAREAVRAATFPPDGTTPEQAAKNMAKTAAGGLVLDDSKIDVDVCAGTPAITQVEITYTFSWSAPMFGKTTDMSGKAAMPCPG